MRHGYRCQSCKQSVTQRPAPDHDRGCVLGHPVAEVEGRHRYKLSPLMSATLRAYSKMWTERMLEWEWIDTR